MRLAIVGAGYVGCVTAAAFAAAGHDVVVYDIEEGRSSQLAEGRAPVDEPGLTDLLIRGRGHLHAAKSIDGAIGDARIAFVCVQTPASADGSIDLTYVERAVAQIVSVRSPAPLVIALRSTVVPGTSDRLDRDLLAPARAAGRSVDIVVNPEFLREGRAVDDHLNPDRIVIGANSATVSSLLRDAYGSSAEFVVVSRASAELAKYTSNALLATLISFSNEIGDFAEAVEGADVVDALRALQLDRRWRLAEGRWSPGILRYLWPGNGYGGSCLPKDVKALIAEGNRRGLPMRLLKATDAINDERARHLAQLIDEVIPLDGLQVVVLGTAFKEGTTDVRDSPGLHLAHELRHHGAKVKTYDPLIDRDDLGDALGPAQVVIVATWAPEFAEIVERVISTQRPIVVDARRQFAEWQSDVRYLGVGRSGVDHP